MTTPKPVSKIRAQVSLFGSVLLIVLMVGIWILIFAGIAAHQISVRNANTAATIVVVLFGCFVLMIVGVLGILNSRYQIRTGVRNRSLDIAMIAVFAIAFLSGLMLRVLRL